jgi:hypothetical protein
LKDLEDPPFSRNSIDMNSGLSEISMGFHDATPESIQSAAKEMDIHGRPLFFLCVSGIDAHWFKSQRKRRYLWTFDGKFME